MTKIQSHCQNIIVLQISLTIDRGRTNNGILNSRFEFLDNYRSGLRGIANSSAREEVC
jgi:hypothetical protein